jgi:hypothetical protein
MEHRCACCKKRFTLDRYHPHQEYCGKEVCQRCRRSKWQREKLKTDADYRANQADAQARWRASHGDYWKKYRASHPGYVERNRVLQGRRREVIKPRDEQHPFVAKMDVAISQPSVKSGRYRLEPVESGDVANMDVVIVQLSVIETLRKTG